MRGSVAGIGCALALVAAGCGGDDEPNSSTPATYYSGFSTAPVTIDSPELGRIYGWLRVKQGAKLLGVPDDGRRVIAAAGCLACHQIGAEGNSGPGNNLDGIGARRSPAQLRRALVDAPAPMPSYSKLPRREREAIVAYLSSLRGGAGCATGSDCG